MRELLPSRKLTNFAKRRSRFVRRVFELASWLIYIAIFTDSNHTHGVLKPGVFRAKREILKFL